MTMRHGRLLTTLAVVFGAAPWGSAPPAHAQVSGFPSRQIQIIVPFPAGGTGSYVSASQLASSSKSVEPPTGSQLTDAPASRAASVAISASVGKINKRTNIKLRAIGLFLAAISMGAPCCCAQTSKLCN